MKICPACSREYPSESTHCHDDGVALVVLHAETQGRPEDLIGQIVDGRYRVERIIGRGGMGIVYACRHVVVGKPAAMKVLRIGVERAEGVLQRFIREAQTANTVRSRHIVEMTDFGQLPNGYCYVVMELLEGMSLTQAMREGRLSRPELLHVFGQMAEALHLVHMQGIVHRDLKPDNVFLVHENNDPLFVKLLDFGIAKAMHAEVSGLTETGVILGTPYYMSPEQARGTNVDHRTDIYALGVMMYRAFTGKLPFVAESMLGVLTRHLTDIPQPPSHIAQIDGHTEHVILRCLEKDPNARFQTGGDLAAALKAIAGRPSLGGATQLIQHPGGQRGASYHGPAQALDFGGLGGLGAPSGAHGAVAAPPTGGYAPARASATPSYPPGTASPSGPHATPTPGVASAVTSGMYAAPGGGYANPSASVPAGAPGQATGGMFAAPGGGYANPSASVPPGTTSAVTSGLYGAPGRGQGNPSASVPPGTPSAVTSGLYSSPALGSGLHASPAQGASVSAITPAPGELPGQGAVPELATQRGLATSDTGRIDLPQKRSGALMVGLPLAVLAAGVMIAVAILVSRGERTPDAPSAAAGSTESAQAAQAPTSAPTQVAASPTAAPDEAPSAEPSAAPAPTDSAAAGASKSTRAPVYTRPAVPAKTSEPTSKPPGKRPEIRSPFE